MHKQESCDNLSWTHMAVKILDQRTIYLSYREGRKGAWSEADQKVYLVQCPHSVKF